MQRSSGMIGLAALLLVTITGCGTTLNMQGMEYLDLTPHIDRPGDRPAYALGGLGNDVAWIHSANQPINVIGALIDMPFSLVGDIITLPWIAYDSLIVVRPPSPQGELRRLYTDADPKDAAPAAKDPR